MTSLIAIYLLISCCSGFLCFFNKQTNQISTKINAQVSVFCKAKDEISFQQFSPKVSQAPFTCGQDSFYVGISNQIISVGIADGVGGWKSKGIDSKKMSLGIMTQAYKLRDNTSPSTNPKNQLNTAFAALSKSYHSNLGSTTVSLSSIDLVSGKFWNANLGDCGYLIIRGGEVVSRSNDQFYSFNAPFQLGIVSNRFNTKFSSPSDAESSKMSLEAGDIIIIASDGLFDNLFDQEIQVFASTFNDIDTLVKRLGFAATDRIYDHNARSPFIVKAEEQSIHYKLHGGKTDDMTIIAISIQ